MRKGKPHAKAVQCQDSRRFKRLRGSREGKQHYELPAGWPKHGIAVPFEAMSRVTGETSVMCLSSRVVMLMIQERADLLSWSRASAFFLLAIRAFIAALLMHQAGGLYVNTRGAGGCKPCSSFLRTGVSLPSYVFEPMQLRICSLY